MENYIIRFYNTDAYSILQCNCHAELMYKIREFIPKLYVRSIEEFEDYELYIRTQKRLII